MDHLTICLLLYVTSVVTLSLALPGQYEFSHHVITQLTLGDVTGSRIWVNGTQVDVYKGIPYAMSPEGELRFKAPEPVSQWVPEVYNATYFRPACWQSRNREPFFQMDSDGYSEDCLHLNIYMPADIQQNKKRSVLVWLHGGSFLWGSSSQHVYDGSMLAATNDVIVVTLNYRLGAFGFLATGTDELQGNMGLQDIIMALQWIQQNIRNFRGNPESVTLVGHETGAIAASLLSLSRKADGLFHRVILQSGTALSPTALTGQREAQSNFLKLATLLRCEAATEAEITQCLREVPANKIAKQQIQVSSSFPNVETDYPWTPIVDGELIQSRPRITLQTIQGFRSRDMILGTTRDIGSALILSLNHDKTSRELFPVSSSMFRNYIHDFLSGHFGLMGDVRLFDSVELLYTNYSAVTSVDENRDMAARMVGESLFKCPLSRTAEILSRKSDQSARIFKYELAEYPGYSFFRNWNRVIWLDEVVFTFGIPWWPSVVSKYDDGERTLSRYVMEAWSSFAKTGNPSSSNAEKLLGKSWPEYSHTLENTLGITLMDTGVSGCAREQLDMRCHFWSYDVPIMLNTSTTPTTSSYKSRQMCSSGISLHSGQLSTLFVVLTLWTLIRKQGVNS